ncbi:hypothetical protein BKA62DRAFT_207321 [Auriculariales sp. MPI-PUGE-AT-0066]|nr:hypothetical protein BKA62DRAFT_207321 [Auriculariales sp. MPI-PUGE-AT-0066]
MQFFVVLSAVLSVALSVQARGDAFVVNCAPLTIQRSDPIVSPGVASGHVHAVVGGNSFSRNMSEPDAALTSTKTTCDKKLDHSVYWIPQLYHQNLDSSFELVKLTGAAIYYMNRACNYTTDLYCDKSKTAMAPPDGLRMIAGTPSRRTYNSSEMSERAINYMCMNDDESHEVYGFPTTPCKLLRTQVFMPSCWDGVNLDSKDHKSHVSYPTGHYTGDFGGGVCPESHPVGIFSLFYEFFFDTSKYGTNDPNGNERLVWAMGDPTGHGLHGDFMMGWTDRQILQEVYDNCEAGNCPINDAGSSADEPPVQGPQTLLSPAVYEEDIGLDGNTIPTLPGNNPVTTGIQSVIRRSRLFI